MKHDVDQKSDQTINALNRDLPDFTAFDPDKVMPSLERILQDYESGLDRMLSEDSISARELLEAETRWADEQEKAWSPASHLNSVTDNEELRVVYNEAIQRLTEHASWRQQNARLYEKYKAWSDSSEFTGLRADLKRLIRLEVREFELSGVGLPPEQQAEYREIMLRKNMLGTRFSEHVLDATQAWSHRVSNREDLDGLPAEELKMLEGLAKEQYPDDPGGWLVNLSQPSYQAIMMHATDRELRKEVYQAYVTRASDMGPNAGQWDNSPVIAEILGLRHRLARLLGFDHFVDYAISRRMADSAEGVLHFLESIAAEAVPHARRQLEDLQEFAASHGAALPLEAWDVAFWSERFRQEELQLSDEELKPYFPLHQMIAAFEHTVKKLFGITLLYDKTVPVWHDDVQFYRVRDEDGQVFAGIYLDLFSRANKRGGAWMDVCQSRYPCMHGVQMPVAFLTCNFSQPSGDQPSLLTHHDVQTLFHEFGHCLHHLMTRIDWPQINGIHGVEWDAVELPSQLMENWAWENTLLDRFARHYQSGEPLPAHLLDRLQRSRHFHKALMLVRQLEYAMVDLRIHLEYDPDNPRDPLEITREVRERFAVIDVPDWNRFLHSFGHIFGGGYAAGYYSYLWAEQLAADAWQRFADEGVFNRQTGHDLIQEILSRGASRPAIKSFEAFRGRPPEPAPLLASYGLGSRVQGLVKSENSSC
jgi:oligopeptidase A